MIAPPIFQPIDANIETTEVIIDKKDNQETYVENTTRNYLFEEGRNFVQSQELLDRVKFKELVRNWNFETFLTSSSHEKIMNQHFQKILEMGPRAVPFIMSEIEHSPSHLVWALNILLGRKISDEDVNVDEACGLWVKWWKQREMTGNEYSV